MSRMGAVRTMDALLHDLIRSSTTGSVRPHAAND